MLIQAKEINTKKERDHHSLAGIFKNRLKRVTYSKKTSDMLEFKGVAETGKGTALVQISRLQSSSVWSELTTSHNPICGHNFLCERAGPFTYTSFCGQQFQSPIHLGAESFLTGVRKQGQTCACF